MTRSGWILAVLAAPFAVGCDRPLWDEAADDEPIVRRTSPAPTIPFAAFSDAVRMTDEEEEDLPGTISRRPASPSFRAEFERRWNEVRFVSPGGHPVQYRAVIDTPFGPFVADLRPDWAPNHVRCFIALARAGCFDEVPLRHLDPASQRHRGLGAIASHDTTSSRLGMARFRLKPEPHEQGRHLAGAIGMESSPDGDTRPERLYIILNAAPNREAAQTVFGHVTHGLETVRRIGWALENDPRQNEPAAEIRSVTIQAREVATW